ncbi:hypothetical protein RZN22_10890 [Bacillaceae bacterium S4-13-58]
MVQSIYQLTEWLDRQKGQDLYITKKEKATGKEEIIDMDEVHIHLSNYSVRDLERESIDGYLAHQELLLQGEGEIRGSENTKEYIPLPQDVFEMPLMGEFKAEESENGFKIDTEKAIYTIRKA